MYLTENNVPRPVILFIDGHSSHLTLQLSVKCEELEMIYIHPPNTIHILQPADEGPFNPVNHEHRENILLVLI